MTAPIAPTLLQRARSIPDVIREWTPQSRLGFTVLRALPYLPSELAAELLDRITSTTIIEAVLRGKAIRTPRSAFFAGYLIEDHGVLSRKVVTTVGVNAIVDAFQNTVELEDFKYHGLGTGSTAEAVGDTALVTELTTEYTGNVRATGTTTEGASANIYRSVGTNTLDSGTPAIVEHGIFSAASVGTLLDRSVFSAINLDGTAGDSLQTTYDLTFTAGG